MSPVDDIDGVRVAASHTPGPWQVSKRTSRKVTNQHGVVICNAVLRNMGGPKHKTCLKAECEAEANASLIAAAPELLAACFWAEAAIAPFSKDPAEKSGISMLRAAIAKARGQ